MTSGRTLLVITAAALAACGCVLIAGLYGEAILTWGRTHPYLATFSAAVSGTLLLVLIGALTIRDRRPK